MTTPAAAAATEYNSSNYWEPHTSSIDFCETNYLFSNYVVEVHNTWSSLLGLAMFGIIGLYYGNLTKELRFQVAYFILIVIGVGSAGLHSTLHWVFQSSDELPMVYLIVTFIYILLELEPPPADPPADPPTCTTPNVTPTTASSTRTLSSSSLKSPMLPWYLLILMIIITIIYYTYQQFYWVFLLTFTGSCLIFDFMVFKMYFYERKDITQKPISKLLFKLASFSFLCIAVPVWLIDMLSCEWTLDVIASTTRGGGFGMTPHVAWHFIAGYAAYCTILYLESFRMNALSRKYGLRFLLGVVPVLIDDDGDNDDDEKKNDNNNNDDGNGNVKKKNE